MAKVLIFTNSFDGNHTDVVARKIAESGSEVIRFDTDKVSQGEHAINYGSASSITLATPSVVHDLLTVDSVWIRRPKVFNFAVHDPAQRAHTEAEFKAFLGGIYAILSDKRWLNTPQAMDRAKLKTYQLELASRVGLAVPESIITADPSIAQEFCSRGPTVFKPLVESNLTQGEKILLIPTTRLTDEHLAKLDLIRNQYVLFQRLIEKQYELRITYVAGKLFVAKQIPVDAKSARTVDWRFLQINGGSEYCADLVGDDLAHKITELMYLLDLNYAALDFAIDSNGRHYFLEANPNGQWFGYTDEIGLPASSAIAEYLTGTENERR